MSTPSSLDARSPSARRGFAAAAASFVAIFAVGATPIPLYSLYGRTDGITPAGFSLVAVVYFVLAVSALLVLGRLSNHLGRKPVGLAAILVAVAGCLVLMDVHDLPTLTTGRALQGLAAGLASSALAAFAVDTAPSRPRWLLPTVTSAGTNIGLTIGAFGAALLVDVAPAPRQLVFGVGIAALAVCAILIALASETLPRSPGALASLRPRIELPREVRPLLPAAAAVFISTWAFGGYFQSFGPSVAADDLGSDDALLAAAVFAAYLAPSALGAPLIARLRPAAGQRLGMALVLVAAVGFVTAIAIGDPAAFLAAGVLGGLGMGAGIAASMRVLLPTAGPRQRAGLLSLVYAVSYLGAAIPSLIAGQLTRVVPLLDITAAYALLAGLATGVVFIATRARSADPGRPAIAETLSPGR